MVKGADTGFFIELAKKNPEAEKIWDKVSVGEEELIVSVITLNELLAHFYKRGKPDDAERYADLLKLMPTITLVSVSSRIAELSAKYKYSLGIPTTDSIILTTFILEKVDQIVTTDSHFKKAEEQGLASVKML